MKKLLALSIIIFLTGCASKKPAETAMHPIDAFEMQCRVNSPKKLCACVASQLKNRVSEGENILTVMSDKGNKLHDTTTDCMISTGMVREMMNEFSLPCYVESPEALMKLDAANRNIDYLKKQYPEKATACSCMQSEIDKLDDRVFIQDSTSANKQYEDYLKCIEKDPSATCQKPKLPFAETIKKKCG